MTDITLPRATVEQALEALEAFMQDSPRPYDAMRGQAAMEALRAALAQQTEPVEPVAEARYDGTLRWLEPHGVGLHRIQGPLYTAPPQQAEPVEPVAWGVDWGRDGDRSCVSITKKRADGTMEIVAVEYGPLYTAPPQQAEPVDTDCHTQGICQRSGYGIPKP